MDRQDKIQNPVYLSRNPENRVQKIGRHASSERKSLLIILSATAILHPDL